MHHTVFVLPTTIDPDAIKIAQQLSSPQKEISSFQKEIKSEDIKTAIEYYVPLSLETSDLEKIIGVLIDPLTQEIHFNTIPSLDNFNYAISIGTLPNVTDPETNITQKVIEAALGKSFPSEKKLKIIRSVFLHEKYSVSDAEWLAKQLANPFTEQSFILPFEHYLDQLQKRVSFPTIKPTQTVSTEEVRALKLK